MARFVPLTITSTAPSDSRQSVLLTGGSEGMGLSVAKMLAAKGANIVIVSRSTDKLKAAVQEIQASSTPAIPQCAN